MRQTFKNMPNQSIYKKKLKKKLVLLFCRTLPFRIYFAYSDHKIQRGATLLEHEEDKTLGIFLDEIFPNIDASVVNSKKN